MSRDSRAVVARPRVVCPKDTTRSTRSASSGRPSNSRPDVSAEPVRDPELGSAIRGQFAASATCLARRLDRSPASTTVRGPISSLKYARGASGTSADTAGLNRQSTASVSGSSSSRLRCAGLLAVNRSKPSTASRNGTPGKMPGCTVVWLAPVPRNRVGTVCSDRQHWSTRVQRLQQRGMQVRDRRARRRHDRRDSPGDLRHAQREERSFAFVHADVQAQESLRIGRCGRPGREARTVNREQRRRR